MHRETERILRTTTCYFIFFFIAVLLTACGSGGGTSSTTPSSTTSAHKIKLPQTGQTTSHAIGDDGNLLKGVPWPTPRFIDNGNWTITDKLTGLMWAKDAGTPTVGSCTGGGLNYISCLNTNNYLGHTDWRLPNFNELKSLYNYGAPKMYSWLEGQGFKNVGIYYFSSSSILNGSNGSIPVGVLVCFDKAYTMCDNSYGQPLSWPVRSSETGVIELYRTGQTTSYVAGDDGSIQTGVPWLNPRFTVGTGGEVDCITDNLTGLMWARNPANNKMTWYDSITYTNDLNICGHTDWRLPNMNELMSLVNIGRPDWTAWLVTQGFYNPPSQIFWSSNSYYDNLYPAQIAFVVNFANPGRGYIDAAEIYEYAYDPYSSSYATGTTNYALPVRDR